MMEMEEKAKTEALYERFRSTFNKLTPQKSDSLLSQFRSLQIDTQEKMEGVVNLVFEMVSFIQIPISSSLFLQNSFRFPAKIYCLALVNHPKKLFMHYS